MTKRLCLVLLAGAAGAYGQVYDTVLANGRVMDPESGLSAVRYVGITAKKIAAISKEPLRGKTVADVKGLVVAPGFIDLHSHGQDDENYHFKAHDGVTTALELELGVSPVAAFYQSRAGHALINFGASSGHVPVRMAVMHDTGTFLPRDEAAHRVATDEETLSIINAVRKGLEEGAIGIGLAVAYVPTAPREEILRMFRLAAERKVPVFIHLRGDGVIAALQEAIADAFIAGAAVHVVHITSVGSRSTATCLEMIADAKKHGLDITTEMYPYTASASRIESALYDGDWEKRTGFKYSDLQWVPTGERMTAESFARFRKEGGAVIAHTLPEEAFRVGITSPFVMIASDGRLVNGQGHPRSAGSFSRVLGLNVREQKLLPLMEALEKMTLMPAQRLQGIVPEMASKGRVKVGADADLTIFDPGKIIDKATFENAGQYSEGIQNVMVGGVFVIRDGKFVDGVYPGVGLHAK
jgi:dihydroorotase